MNQEKEQDMSKFTSLIRRAPKRFSAVVAIIAAAIIVPVVVFAWGPGRQTFTIEQPADYVTFNSIVNNPAHGDERNFVQIKEAGASNSTYTDSISLTPGKTYTVFMYYHNNAASNLNASGAGIARDTKVRAELPTVVSKGSNGTTANGYISASNATPKVVWDDISLKNSTAGDIAIRYVSGSAKIYNNGAINGSTLPDSIITSGATIGYNALDGTVPGCNEYSGYVTFNFVADQPDFTLTKQVRLAGTTEWQENVTAQPGATVEYQLRYQNIGTTQQNNVILKDVLPTHMQYVAGSSVLKNTSNPNGKNVSDGLVSSEGINIGDYAPNSTAYLKFSAQVANDRAAFCTAKSLKNIATVYTANGSKQDDATVEIAAQDCGDLMTVCDVDSKTIITIDRGDFDTSKHTSDMSKCTELPQTGTTENIVAIIGLGALIASMSYFIASRRALNQ